MSKKKDPALLTKEQIRKFKEKEQEAKDFYGFLDVAKSVAKAGDKDWARKLYKKAEELAEDSFDFQVVAESVAKAGDKEWARELYKKVEDLANNSLDYRGIAKSIASEDYLCDQEWARQLYNKAEDLAEDLIDYQGLAESIAHDAYLGDKDWARKIYKKAEELAENSEDYQVQKLAESIENSLGDKEWAHDILKKENKKGDITMEIFYEEHKRIVNKINFSTNQEFDVSNFNADDYEYLIIKENFLEDVTEAIMKSDTWRWDYNQENSKKLNLNYMRNAVRNDAIMIRFTKIRDLDLSFLSVENDFAEKTAEHEQFLKGTDYECNLSDDDFEDYWNDFLSCTLLALEHIFRKYTRLL